MSNYLRNKDQNTEFKEIYDAEEEETDIDEFFDNKYDEGNYKMGKYGEQNNEDNYKKYTYDENNYFDNGNLY